MVFLLLKSYGTQKSLMQITLNEVKINSSGAYYRSFPRRVDIQWLIPGVVCCVQPIAEGSERSVRWVQTAASAGTQVRTPHPDDVWLHATGGSHECNHRSHRWTLSFWRTIQGRPNCPKSLLNSISISYLRTMLLDQMASCYVCSLFYLHNFN